MTPNAPWPATWSAPHGDLRLPAQAEQELGHRHAREELVAPHRAATAAMPPVVRIATSEENIMNQVTERSTLWRARNRVSMTLRPRNAPHGDQRRGHCHHRPAGERLQGLQVSDGCRYLGRRLLEDVAGCDLPDLADEKVLLRGRPSRRRRDSSPAPACRSRCSGRAATGEGTQRRARRSRSPRSVRDRLDGSASFPTRRVACVARGRRRGMRRQAQQAP